MSNDGMISGEGTDEPATPQDFEDQSASDAVTITADADGANNDDGATDSGDVGGGAEQSGTLKRDVNAIIKRHAAYGLASGIIPVPLVDLTVASTIQLRMIAQLADLYGVPFSKQVAKSTVAALVASAIPVAGVGAASISLVRAVPIAGPILGFATLPALYSAITYALGRTFAWHFSQGGTFETIDPKTLRARFSREVSKARDANAEPAAA